jgi:hypothetical protein
MVANAVDGGVLRRLAVADRLHGRFLDILRRIEVRFAGAEPDDVTAGGLERARFVGDRDGRRWLDARQTVREEGHCSSPGAPKARAS